MVRLVVENRTRADGRRARNCGGLPRQWPGEGRAVTPRNGLAPREAWPVAPREAWPVGGRSQARCGHPDGACRPRLAGPAASVCSPTRGRLARLCCCRSRRRAALRRSVQRRQACDATPRGNDPSLPNGGKLGRPLDLAALPGDPFAHAVSKREPDRQGDQRVKSLSTAVRAVRRSARCLRCGSASGLPPRRDMYLIACVWATNWVATTGIAGERNDA
jgi:hypothetical protein